MPVGYMALPQLVPPPLPAAEEGQLQQQPLPAADQQQPLLATDQGQQSHSQQAHPTGSARESPRAGHSQPHESGNAPTAGIGEADSDGEFDDDFSDDGEDADELDAVEALAGMQGMPAARGSMVVESPPPPRRQDHRLFGNLRGMLAGWGGGAMAGSAAASQGLGNGHATPAPSTGAATQVNVERESRRLDALPEPTQLAFGPAISTVQASGPAALAPHGPAVGRRTRRRGGVNGGGSSHTGTSAVLEGVENHGAEVGVGLALGKRTRKGTQKMNL